MEYATLIPVSGKEQKVTPGEKIFTPKELESLTLGSFQMGGISMSEIMVMNEQEQVLKNPKKENKKATKLWQKAFPNQKTVIFGDVVVSPVSFLK